MTDELPYRIRLLFEDGVNNLRFFKQQQWVITNYALVAYGAIYISAKAVISLAPLLMVLIWIVYGLSVFFLVDLTKAIEKFRRRIDHIYASYFPYGEHGVYDLGLDKKSWTIRWGYSWALIIVSLIGAATATLAIHALPRF
jgi:hypothetical protein